MQAGGFGNPFALAGQAPGGNPGSLLKVGGFDLAGGAGRGNGTAESRGTPQVVADAGFGGRPAETAVTEISESDISHQVAGAGFGNGGVNVGGNGRSGDAAPSAVKTGAFSTPESAQTLPIRFKPAEQGGKPINFPAVLHIEFRLA